MKFHSVGAELLNADRRTDRHDKAKVAFWNFVDAPNIQFAGEL
jgi:hypothetical protein